MFDGWTDEQFAIWMAGYFDGEGCVYLPKGSGIAVSVASTNGEVIECIQSRLQIGVVEVVEFKNQRNWKTKHVWRERRYKESHDFLMMVRPFLTIKASKADAGLARCHAYLAKVEAMRMRNAEIVLLSNQGHTHKEIAKRFGLCRSAVTIIVEWIALHGNIPRPRSRKLRIDYSEAGKKRVVQARTRLTRLV